MDVSRNRPADALRAAIAGASHGREAIGAAADPPAARHQWTVQPDRAGAARLGARPARLAVARDRLARRAGGRRGAGRARPRSPSWERLAELAEAIDTEGPEPALFASADAVSDLVGFEPFEREVLRSHGGARPAAAPRLAARPAVRQRRKPARPGRAPRRRRPERRRAAGPPLRAGPARPGLGRRGRLPWRAAWTSGSTGASGA